MDSPQRGTVDAAIEFQKFIGESLRFKNAPL